MNQVITDHGLCFTYLCDPFTIEDLDQDRILEDLSNDGPDGDPLPWLTRYTFADHDHLVLVVDRQTGRHLALLGANNGSAGRDEFLLLETAFVASVARGQNLMRRMIALALLRIGGVGQVPSAIVACARNPLCYQIMRNTARRFTSAVFFPDPDSVAINFRAATLAQRITRVMRPADRMLALLDLRGQDDAVILEDARRIYRSR